MSTDLMPGKPVGQAPQKLIDAPMSDYSLILEENRVLRLELETLRVGEMAQREQAALASRVSPFTVKEFAGLIRRHHEYVSERCKIGVIKSLPGKPYRIPVSQLRAWTEAA